MKHFKIVAAAGMLAGFCWSSLATMLPTGGSGPPDAPQAPGTDIIATRTSPYSVFGVGVVGTVTSWVVANPQSNIPGALSFYYQITPLTQNVRGLNTLNFGTNPNALLDVSTVAGAFDSSVPGGVIPDVVFRSSSGGINFHFADPGLPPGESSAVMIVNTPYVLFTTQIGNVTPPGPGVSSVVILGPVLVPEPATIVAVSLLLLPVGSAINGLAPHPAFARVAFYCRGLPALRHPAVFSRRAGQLKDFGKVESYFVLDDFTQGNVRDSEIRGVCDEWPGHLPTAGVQLADAA